MIQVLLRLFRAFVVALYYVTRIIIRIFSLKENVSHKHKTMDPINETQKIITEKVHGPRYERNRKYYLKHTHESLRSTLLHNVKSKGRIPSMLTAKKYDLKPEELIKEWRLYRSKVTSLCPLKEMKFKVLISNIL